MGNVIADALLAATDNEQGAVAALMNPGGVAYCTPLPMPTNVGQSPHTSVTTSGTVVVYGRIAALRYKANPLVIRGPGAGAEVTAAGVLNDILRLAGA